MNHYKKLMRSITLMAVLLMAAISAGAQASHPYAGIWYIINGTNSITGYWVPAADPQITTAGHVNEDAYFSSDYSTQPGDPEKPFLTTYPTGGDLNSIWIFVPVSGENNYYYIVHALTGKYLKFQTYYSDARRKYVHLETITTPGETEKFLIEAYSPGVKIKPKNHSYYMNVAGDNQERYNGGTATGYFSGMIGGYSSTNDGSKFTLTDASSATTLTPVISTVDPSTNTFTITSPAAAFSTIRYTTNGSTTPDANTGTTVTSGDNINITSNITVQAVGVFKDTFVTPLAGPQALSPAPCATPDISFDYTTSMVSITCATPSSTIYYTTNGDTPTTGSSEYSGSFSVASDVTIKAIATRTNWNNSAVAELTISQVVTPTIQNNGSNAVSITTTTPGATIYYTLDGSTPTALSSEYTVPLRENVSGVTIKAIATKENMIPSAVGSGMVTLQCATPVIRRLNNTSFTATCAFPSTGVTIYYTTDGSTPTTSNSSFSPGSAMSISLPATVKAIAVATNYSNSAVAIANLTEGMGGSGIAADPYTIEYQSDVEDFIAKANDPDEASKYYKVTATAPLDFSGVAAITEPFSGTFDGNFQTLTGLTHALFNTVDGGTVKDVVLSGVNITTGTNVGALCNEADGTTKIYNCGILSGSVTGTVNVGGLVGLINSGSSVRVVNCYNYANVSGGTYAAGIVGKNEGTVSSDGTVGNVRIALCMMYGNVTGATNISPVYCGNHVNNVSKYTEYNYWRYRSGLQYTAYNDQMAIDKDEYLTRFPYYRHILNTHREMAAYFLFGAVSCNDLGDITSAQIAEIGHWTVNKEVAPYPIIEPWPSNTTTTPTSTHNNLPSTTDDYAGKLLTTMGDNGYLPVTVHIGSNDYSVRLPITDMDTLNYDFTWGKVVLPFANEFVVNSDYSIVCTGWKITSVTKDGSSYTTFSATNKNYADRDNPQKDIYDASNNTFIFAQGGNYIVPYGVTAIEITANFATAYYLCDASYEIGYSGDGGTSGYTGRTGLGGTTANSYHGQTVYKTLPAALTEMSASNTTHSQAVVLVGNYHMDNDNQSTFTTKGYTIMSIDADNNQEPDYAIYSNNTQDRPAIPPTRFDFVAFIPMGMSSHVNGAKFYPNTPIWKSRGWFEITETGLIRADQFELESGNFNENKTNNCRCIINGGYFTQMVRSNSAACTKLSYYQIGGKAYVKEFYPGNHSKKNHANTLVPVNVTGGEIEQCFMTGYGLGTVTGSDIYFWCAGGKIHKFLGSYMENPSTTGVNMTAKIDHARIYRFFGGGTTSKARITGNIDVTIDNSLVDFYCGGPEFGDMVTGENGKTVTTHATGTTFGEYFGAGFGGTATTYTNDEDDSKNLTASYTYPSSFFTSHYLASASDVGRLDYKDGYGIGNCYKFEFIIHSRGHQSVARFYTGYASFSLAKTGSVTNVLDHCTILNSFYGGGCQGTVDGTVTSTLTDCTVLHSAFGGGYKAAANEVEVYPTTAPSLSVFTAETGIFSDFGTVAPETYTWAQGDETTQNTVSGTTLYTSKDITMNDLGNVTGAITLTLDGNTTVQDNVFGGGNESKSLDNTTVKLQDGAHVLGNVYGGGNNGAVGGKSSVTIENE